MKRKLKFLLCLMLVTTVLKSDLQPCQLIQAPTKEAIYNWCVLICPDQGEKVQDCINYYDVGEAACLDKDMIFPDCSN